MVDVHKQNRFGIITWMMTWGKCLSFQVSFHSFWSTIESTDMPYIYFSEINKQIINYNNFNNDYNVNIFIIILVEVETLEITVFRDYWVILLYYLFTLGFVLILMYKAKGYRTIIAITFILMSKKAFFAKPFYEMVIEIKLMICMM